MARKQPQLLITDQSEKKEAVDWKKAYIDLYKGVAQMLVKARNENTRPDQVLANWDHLRMGLPTYE